MMNSFPSPSVYIFIFVSLLALVENPTLRIQKNELSAPHPDAGAGSCLTNPPSSAHVSLCDAAAQWCVVHHVSAFDLATPGIEGRCCVSLSSLSNERPCVVFCVISWQRNVGFILLF